MEYYTALRPNKLQFQQQHEWILQIWCSAKEARYKRIHAYDSIYTKFKDMQN